MNLIISFSGRENGNCDQIAAFISSANDIVVPFRKLNFHPCSGCEYECFTGECKYRADDIYSLYAKMPDCSKVVLIVPMYCGSPSSLYCIFHERCQDYFMHNGTYNTILQRLYIIGVYGKQEDAPDFVPALEKWFSGSPYIGRVLGIERHLYGQRLSDNVLDVEEVRDAIRSFLQG